MSGNCFSGDYELVVGLFDADFDAGVLRWKRSGRIAGGPHKEGYMAVYVVDQNGRRRGLLVHRVLWLMKHGRYPSQTLDHANGIRTDNRMCNLREASYAQNNANRKAVRRGLKGACLDKRTGRYVAQINIRGRNVFLGRHDTEQLAHEAYMEAARAAYGEFASA